MSRFLLKSRPRPSSAIPHRCIDGTACEGDTGFDFGTTWFAQLPTKPGEISLGQSRSGLATEVWDGEDDLLSTHLDFLRTRKAATEDVGGVSVSKKKRKTICMTEQCWRSGGRAHARPIAGIQLHD